MAATTVAQTAAGVADGTGPLLQHVAGTTTAGATVTAAGTTVTSTTVAGTAGTAGAKAVVGSKIAAIAATGSAVLGIALVGAACYVGYRVARKIIRHGSETDAEEEATDAAATPATAKAK